MIARTTATAAALLWLISTSVNGQTRETPPETAQGRALDIGRGAGSAIDPTENVKALSEAANKRQDDLRSASEKLIEAKLEALKELADLRAEHAKSQADAETRRVNEQLALRGEYNDRLSLAEAKRIDAIRAVDVNAVAVASQRSGDQATALASQVAQSAEVLRNQVSRSAEDLRALVATTAATALQNQQQQFASQSTRITALEQAQSEGKGKSTYTDPALVTLLQEMKALRATDNLSAGKSDGISATTAIMLAVGTFILALVGAIIAFAMFNRTAMAKS